MDLQVPTARVGDRDTGHHVLQEATCWSEWSAQAVVRAVVHSVCTTGMLLPGVWGWA